MVKAVLLFSGGLDSILTAYILKREGIKVAALYCHTVFFTLSRKEAYNRFLRILSPLKIPLKVVDISSIHISLLKNARYGYGKNLNPCIDCKIAMFKEAAVYKNSIGADFIASGEVLGERPMSQRKDTFDIIERDAGLKGFVLRPLSAKLLKPTVVESKGFIRRGNLYGIQGRSRSSQIMLAEEFGIENFPTPSGGCLLTNPSFCRRLKDMLVHKSDFGICDCQLLKVGRHFRLSTSAKLIVSRNENENLKLKRLAREGTVSIYPLYTKGPFAVIDGKFNKQLIDKAVRVVAGYCKVNSSSLKIRVDTPEGEFTVEISNDLVLREEGRELLI